MTRPTDWSPVGYSSDPVPGNPSHVDVVGRMYIGTADSIDRAASNLSTAVSESFGQAEVLDAIREQAEELAGRIVKAEERYRGVGEAMVAYAVALGQAQTDSADALQRASDAAGDASWARSRVAYYEGRIADASTPPANLPNLRTQLSEWETSLSVAESGTGSATEDVASAVSARDGAAQTAIDAIELVESTGDLNDGFWDDVSQWVAEHKDILDAIGNVLGAIAAIAGLVLLLIPGLNAIVLAVIAVVLVVNLAYSVLNGALQVSTGNMSPAEAIVGVGMAALSFVGAGAALRTGITAAREGMRAAIRSSGVAGMTRGNARTIVDNLTNAATPGQFLRPGQLTTSAQQTRLLWQALDANPQQLAVLTQLARYTVNGRVVPEAVNALRGAGAAIFGVQAVDALAADPIANAIDPLFPDVEPWRFYGEGVDTRFGRW